MTEIYKVWGKLRIWKYDECKNLHWEDGKYGWPRDFNDAFAVLIEQGKLNLRGVKMYRVTEWLVDQNQGTIAPLQQVILLSLAIWGKKKVVSIQFQSEIRILSDTRRKIEKDEGRIWKEKTLPPVIVPPSLADAQSTS